MLRSSNPSDHFGVDIDQLLRLRWMEYLPQFRAEFPGKDFAIAILDPAERDRYDWRNPLAYRLHLLTTGQANTEVFAGKEGLIENIGRKLRFVMRTHGLRSKDITANPGLALPGDFPWDGAGWHMGFLGGGSGLSETDDWDQYCKWVGVLDELRSEAGERAIKACKDGEPGAKYMEIDLTTLAEDRHVCGA